MLGGIGRSDSHDSPRSTLARAGRNLGLGAWFGGSLMGVLAVNRSLRPTVQGRAEGDALNDPLTRARILAEVWRRWTVPALVGIGAHLAGSLRLTWTGKGHGFAQPGVARTMAVDTALNTAAVGAALVALRRRRGLAAAADEGADPAELEERWRRLARVGWMVPAFTGGALVAQARLAEGLRPAATAQGLWARLTPGRS